MGIDEAGRGPVLGPMVYGCAIVRADDVAKLETIGVDDSKALTDSKRRRIFELMRQKSESDEKLLTYSVRVVHPRTISAQMQRRVKQSLNEISHLCAVALIERALQRGICLSEVYVDLVGNKEEVYQAFLNERFPSLKIIVSKKADSIFRIVGAASIVAKVTRDDKLAEWVFEERGFIAPEEGIGSGYPADPLTKKFIRTMVDPVFGYPSLVRFSWKTVERVLERRAIKYTWDTPSLDTSKQLTLTELWSKAREKKRSPTKKGVRRHAFFTERGLSNATELI
uniref:Ribonuclease n=1 Tax=Globodera rostochiensis TaxID=31243 RepID=A0A914IAU9_GLORO